MALDRIRRKQEEEAARVAEALRHAEEEEDRREQAYKQSIMSSLRCLKLVEPYFWECVDDFSELIHYKVREDSRLLGRFSSAEEDPELFAKYDIKSYKVEQGSRVALKAIPNAIKFSADSRGIISYRHQDVSLNDTYTIDSFDEEEARNWIESQFERYYMEYDKWRCFINKCP